MVHLQMNILVPGVLAATLHRQLYLMCIRRSLSYTLTMEMSQGIQANQKPFYPMIQNADRKLISTFYSQYCCKLHTQSPNFSILLLLVCATESRYSTNTHMLPTSQELQDEPES